MKYYLNNEPVNDFENYIADRKYTYLVIPIYEKPKRHCKKNESDWEIYDKQQITLQKLQTGKYNCYNSPYTAEDISVLITDIINDFASFHIYKIEPTSCLKEHSFGRDERYKFYEFNIIEEITDIKRLFYYFVKDGIIEEVLAKVISYYSVNKNDIDDFRPLLEQIKQACLNGNKFLSFSNLCENLQFLSFDCSNRQDELMLDLCVKKDIKVWQEYDNIYSIIRNCVNKSLYKTLLFYVKEYIQNINEKINIEKLQYLKQYSDIQEIKEVMDLLGIKFCKMTLQVFDANTERMIESVPVENLDEAKTYIIKNYNVSYSEAKDDISDIHEYDNDGYYKTSFRIEE